MASLGWRCRARWPRRQLRSCACGAQDDDYAPGEDIGTFALMNSGTCRHSGKDEGKCPLDYVEAHLPAFEVLLGRME